MQLPDEGHSETGKLFDDKYGSHPCHYAHSAHAYGGHMLCPTAACTCFPEYIHRIEDDHKRPCQHDKDSVCEGKQNWPPDVRPPEIQESLSEAQTPVLILLSLKKVLQLKFHLGTCLGSTQPDQGLPGCIAAAMTQKPDGWFGDATKTGGEEKGKSDRDSGEDPPVDNCTYAVCHQDANAHHEGEEGEKGSTPVRRAVLGDEQGTIGSEEGAPQAAGQTANNEEAHVGSKTNEKPAKACGEATQEDGFLGTNGGAQVAT